jgi:hypothetical protein
MSCQRSRFRWPLLARLLGSLLLLLGTSVAWGGGPKVTICHVPPGNPSNAHTITISQSAIPAHLAHGDRLGSCAGGPCAVNPCLNLGICSATESGGFTCQCISNGGLGETVGSICACAPGCTPVVTGGCSCGSSG